MDGLTDVCEQMFIFLVFILGLKDIFTTNSVIKAAFFQMGLIICLYIYSFLYNALNLTHHTPVY